jgi:hypothetical protein
MIILYIGSIHFKVIAVARYRSKAVLFVARSTRFRHEHCSSCREISRDMPQTQTSANTALRAIVMLAFIVTIPLIAINGSSLPEKAKNIIEKYWPIVASIVGKPADSQPNPLPAQASGDKVQRVRQQASSVIPAAYQSVVEPGLNIPGNTGPVNNNTAQADANPFMALQDRLRQLGATYYLLETWGNQRQYYRFYCQMAVGGNAGYTHYFEAINANPLEAMADVLRQVEAWRGRGNTAR